VATLCNGLVHYRSPLVAVERATSPTWRAPKTGSL